MNASMTGTSLAEKIAQRRPLLGIFHDIIDPALIEISVYCGFDFVVLEAEHGLRNPETLQHLIRAAQHAGGHVLVRMPGVDQGAIMRVLDAGADGVSIAHVTSREQAEMAVRAAKFPPGGTRSEGYARRGHAWTFGPKNREWQLRANRETVVIAIVEDEIGVQNIDGIVATPGLNAVQPGPGDLALDLGGVAFDGPEVVAALAKVREACERAGVPHVGFVAAPDQIQSERDSGATMFIYGHDLTSIGDLFSDFVSRARPHLGRSDQAQ